MNKWVETSVDVWSHGRMRLLPRGLKRLFGVEHARIAVSEAAAAELITRGSGISPGPHEARQLRTGMSEDAAAQQFAGIADLLRDDLTNPSDELMVEARMNLVAALRDNGVRNLQVCFRGVPQPPTPDSINALAQMINNIAEHGGR